MQLARKRDGCRDRRRDTEPGEILVQRQSGEAAGESGNRRAEQRPRQPAVSRGASADRDVDGSDPRGREMEGEQAVEPARRPVGLNGLVPGRGRTREQPVQGAGERLGGDIDRRVPVCVRSGALGQDRGDRSVERCHEIGHEIRSRGRFKAVERAGHGLQDHALQPKRLTADALPGGTRAGGTMDSRPVRLDSLRAAFEDRWIGSSVARHGAAAPVASPAVA